MTSMKTASLGEFLRHERENRGFTVEQVASATKISLRLLQALENDLYEELPAKPFVRGFVISYCRFLGVNPNETLTRFSRFIDEKSEKRPRKDSGHSGYVFERREGEQSRTGLWILMGTLMVVGGLVIVVAKPSLKKRRHGHLEQLREVQPSSSPLPSPSLAPSPSPSLAPSLSPAPSPSPSPSPSVAASPSPAPSPAPSPSPSSSPNPTASPEAGRRPDPLLSGKDLLKEEIRVRVVVKAVRDMWIKFKVDDKDKNRLVLREGIVLVLLARNSVSIQSSNPGDASVTRQVGEPKALLTLGGASTLEGLLKSGAGTSEDGRTLTVVAKDVEIKGNPFAGEAVMAPPPPKPQGAASEIPAPSP
ncbi:MAG: helix-turn-helix domain-containing protein [Oligoflexia bacterium]